MTRAESIERAAAKLLAPRHKELMGIPTIDNTRCACGCDDDVEALRASLALPREESAEGWILRDPGESLADACSYGISPLRQFDDAQSKSIRVLVTAAPEGEEP